MAHAGSQERVGIICQPDHPVMSAVGVRLADHGLDVAFFDPDSSIGSTELAGLSILVCKRTRPASIRALIAAQRLGVSTWNSATGVQACLTRFTQQCALAAVGFPVPNSSRTRPDGDYVAKGLYHWQSTLEVNGEGDVYEELLPTDPIDFKYYVVDDGTTARTRVVRVTSKLWGEKRVLGWAEPVSELVDRITTLMDRLEMRGIGVDVIRVDGVWYAVDLNPCPDFTGAGMDAVIARSIEACLD